MPGAPLLVVGAAIVRDGRLLAAQRAHPPALAGQWELPGGKVEPGEDDRVALARECREELGIEIAVGPRLTGDVPTIGVEGLLRTYVCDLVAGDPEAREHQALRWLGSHELEAVPWLRSDLALLPALADLLRPRAP